MADALIKRDIVRWWLDEFSKLTEKQRNEPGAGLMVYSMDGADAVIRALRDGLDRLQTVDAVPVVRCRACKFHRNAGCPMRTLHASPYGYKINDSTTDDGFCHMGKKMDGGGEG